MNKILYPEVFNSLAAHAPGKKNKGSKECLLRTSCLTTVSALALMVAGGFQVASATTYPPPGSCLTGGAAVLIGQVVAAPPTMGPTDGSGTFSSVLGCNASGGGQHAVSVFGTYASAVGEAGSAFGFYSLAGKWASGFGLSSTATGIGSTALGFGARAISTNAVAIGGAGGNGVTALTVANSTTASGVGSIAIGSNTLRGAQAAGTDAIAIGGQSTASFSSGIAIGRGSTSAGAFGLAAGDGASASTNGIAIGKGTIATGTSSISIGLGNNVSGNNSGAIGDPSTVTGANSYSLGNNNSVASNNAFALGNNITIPTGLDGSVVLGNDSTVSASVPTAGDTINGVTYNYAGATPVVGGVVSVGSAGGERQITNVAAGQVSSASTDAVNGSQLFATNTSVNSLGTTVNNIVNNGAGIKYFHSNSILADSLASGTDSVAVGPAATASASNAMALGNGATATIADSVALGSGATTAAAVASTGDTINGTAYTYAGGAPIGVLSLGSAGSERQITNVAAGQVSSASTDAVNGSQLFATNTSVNGLGTTVNNIVNNGTGIKYFHTSSILADSLASGTDSVAVGPAATASASNAMALGNGATATIADSVALGSGATTTAAIANLGNTINGTAYTYAGGAPIGVLSVGSVGSERQITNVAAGQVSSTSTDAVNGSQLFATNTAVDVLGVSVNNIVNNGAGIKYFHSNSSLADSTATGIDSVAIGPQAVAVGAQSVALGTGAAANHAGSVALGSSAVTTVGAQSGYTAYGLSAAQNSVGEVGVGTALGDRKITGVAAGSALNDAVNVEQLTAVGNQVAQNTTNISNLDGRVTNLEGDILNVSGGITSVVNRVTQVESNVTNLQSGKDGMFQVNNTSAASKPSVTGTNAIAAGPGAVASGNNSAAIGTNAKASGTNSVAVGHDASATGNNSVALGANSVGTRDNSVSVGAVGSERQITNVAAATEGTDAVNFDQLNKSVANITNNTTAYTDQRFSELKRDLKKQDNTLSAGIAGAMAMASLPQPYSPGASMTSIAVANYRGQSALSFGISRISDNGRWVGKLQASTSTQGDTGVGLGIGYQW